MGIFADTDPNLPMISQYMRLAVKAFGKPRIQFLGDASMYRPWLNVPVALVLFTHKGLDANYHFGNLFYHCCAQMDRKQFKLKSNALHIKLLRRLTLPVRRMFFNFTNERPTWYNRLVSRALNKLGY